MPEAPTEVVDRVRQRLREKTRILRLSVVPVDADVFPADFRRRTEETLGEAYSEPGADVHGYFDYVRSQNA